MDTLSLMLLVEWVHHFGDFKSMGARLEEYLLSDQHKNRTKDTIRRYPYTWLIASTAFQARRLFDYALSFVSYDMVRPRWIIDLYGQGNWIARLEQIYGETGDENLPFQLAGDKVLMKYVHDMQALITKAYNGITQLITATQPKVRISPEKFLARAIAMRAWSRYLVASRYGDFRPGNSILEMHNDIDQTFIRPFYDDESGDESDNGSEDDSEHEPPTAECCIAASVVLTDYEHDETSNQELLGNITSGT